MRPKIYLNVLPTNKSHVSFSETNDWVGCAWRHRLKQIDKIDLQIPSPIPMFGKVIHSACEKFLKTREMDIETALKSLQEQFVEQRNKTQEELNITDEQYEKYVNNFCEFEQKKFEKELLGILADVPKFMDMTFPNWEYIDAEHQLMEEIENTPYLFKGYIDGIIKCDIIGKRSTKKAIYVLDWKTSWFGWDRKKRDDQNIKNQLVYYKHFWAKKTSTPLKDIKCGFIILKRMAKVGNHCELFTVSVGDVTISRAIKNIYNMFYALNNNIFLKNRDSCIWCDFCNTQYCDSVFKIIK